MIHTPLLLSIETFDTRIFLKHRPVPLRRFLVLWDKVLSTENSEIPLLYVSFSIPDFFWNTEGLPYETFRYCETQTLTKNRDTLPSSLIYTIFETRFFSETHKGSPTILFGTVRQKLWQKIVIHTPLLLSIETFDTRIFLKHRPVPLRNFSTLRGKKLMAQKKISLFCVKFFETRFFSEIQKGSPRKFSILWDTDFDKKPWYTPLFSYP